MIRRILLPTILLILAYGFWISPSFKEIAAGVAIFLFGMMGLEEGFRAFTGGTLEKLLKRTTDRIWKSMSVGAVTTAVMQSSSLISLITISFLGAGLISLAGGAGIIFGANLGTTSTAWIVAGFGVKVKLAAYALPMIVFGVILIFQKSKKLTGIGYVLAGLGFLLLGIDYMKIGFDSFREGIDLSAYAVSGTKGVLLFVLIGLTATVITQSSSATIVLVITALASGQVSYENALAMAIGSNVGTTITAVIGSLGSNVDGKRLAAIHFVFNFVTGIIAVIFIWDLINVVENISLSIGLAADDYMLKLAVFHTVFNVIGIVVMTPFIRPMVKQVIRFMPGKVAEFEKPKFLNAASLEYADSAIEAARNETIRLFEKAIEIIAHGIGLRKHEILSEKDLKELVASPREVFDESIDERYDRSIKSIYSEIVAFISKAPENMSAEQRAMIYDIRMAGRDVGEAVKAVKHLRKNMFDPEYSGHADMRTEYDQIRKQIALVLRELAEVRDDEDGLEILSLNDLLVRLKKDYEKANRQIDKLVRENRIDPRAATSLINDNGYAYEAGKNLIDMGQVVFASHDVSEREAEKSLVLDETEENEETKA